MPRAISKWNKAQEGTPSQTDRKRLSFLQSRLQSESGSDAAETRAEIEELEKEETAFQKRTAKNAQGNLRRF